MCWSPARCAGESCLRCRGASQSHHPSARGAGGLLGDHGDDAWAALRQMRVDEGSSLSGVRLLAINPPYTLVLLQAESPAALRHLGHTERGWHRPSGLPARGRAPRASGLPRPDGVCEQRQVPAERCPARRAPQPALPNPRHMLRSALHLPMGSLRAWHRREGRRKSGSPIWKEFSG